MEAAKIVSEILRRLSLSCIPDINLLYLERMAQALIKGFGAESYNKGYQPKFAKTPFPSILCLNVNDELAHTPPKDYKLKSGDILTIDVGIKYKGEVADAALTVGVGEISNRDRRLIKAAKKALYMGIGKVKAGAKISEIGIAIEDYCKVFGYTVNCSLNGHGIGKEMHEAPSIPMFNVTDRIIDPEKEPVLKDGQIICLEPHISFKDRYGFLQEDEWSVKTRDGRKAAMFEHMVRVKTDGFEILTDHVTLTPEDLRP